MRIFALLCLTLGSVAVTCARAAERPNVLWITAEDMSPTLGCYGDAYAVTPHIDALAKQSVRYTRAFATAPVCSPSRSCLITGCYATGLGTHQMRSAFPIPKKIKGFPAYLRAAGYYTTNNVKTDYNTANWQRLVKDSWDESSARAHWGKRKDRSQPFFSVMNLMTSHQSRSMVWPREQFVKEVQSLLAPGEIHDPARAPLPPYYPDTPIIRREWARYHDCVTAMDKQVGAILKQLDDDGLADNTIVFFYSDHGSGMPRHKRCLLDSGMHVPLLVRFPEKWQHLAPGKPGSTTGRLVSFVDFGPSVLSIAGVDIPDYMQGQPFLGKANTVPRKYVFGHRDRIDEVMDVARSVRSRRYLYIRNYMPHFGYNQRSAWPDQGEICGEFYRLADRAKMTDAQWHFAGPTRPAIELYDCDEDPQNLVNLAASPQHRAVLDELAAAAGKHRDTSHDVGFLPELEAWKIARKRPLWEAVRSGPLELAAVNRAAESVGGADAAHAQEKLSSPNASVRYWGVVALRQHKTLSAAAMRSLVAALSDSSAAVRIAAAETVAAHDNLERALPVLEKALASDDLTTVLYAARAIELLGPRAAAATAAMKRAHARAQEIRSPDTPPTVVTAGQQNLAMFIGFSTTAYLSAVEPDE
ncbi:MAG: sulfatase-like hydrolase/transferase [Pirellulales bacterium]|nr:sulfatase-like hydrolase/transferase [Pirellulales bacterium]